MSKKGSSPSGILNSVFWLALGAVVVYLIARNVRVVSNVAVVLLGFGAVVLVHEFGHFIVAKLCGIKVEAFSLFMPPTVLGSRRTAKGLHLRVLPMLFSKSSESAQEAEEGGLSFTLGKGGQESDTEYRFGLIPFGGYVKLLGQDDVGPVKQISDPRSFANKSVGVRAAVIAAGVTFNVISAAIVLMIVFLVGINFPPPVVGDVVPDSPAAKAGLQPGDEFIEIDGETRNLDFTSISLAAVLSDANEAVPVTVQHPDGTVEEIGLVARKLPGAQMREFGIEQPLSLTLAQVSDPNALEQQTGLLPGDTVIAVAGRPVEHKWTFDAIVREALSPNVTVTAQRTTKDGGAEQVQTELDLAWVAGEGNVKSDSDLANVYSIVPRLCVLHDQRANDDKDENPQRLLAGDIIVAVDTVENPTYLELRETTVKFEDKPLPVKVLRADPNGTERVVTITVTPRRDPVDDRVVIGFFPVLDAEHAIVAKTVASEGGVARLDLPRGARITTVGGQAVASFYDVIREVRRWEGQPVALEYRLEDGSHGGVTLQAAGAAAPIQVQSTPLAVLPFKGLERLYRAAAPLDAIKMGYRRTVMFITMTYITLAQLIGGLLSPKLLMGPVGIVVSSYQIVESQPLIYYAYFLGLISASIAVLNFLPLPPFDGGLIVLMLIEKIKGSALSEKAQGIVAYAGWVLVLTLLIYVTYNDIVRTISGFFS
ncbi:MAG: site-2 protease family protein [Sedimentisphaerales bacterium]|nr:site-2 protease family protein [Sedimentisphaerales bacterium]